jgi:hypothetical protein
MNKEEYDCPIDGCDASFFTAVGLNFHVKSKHGEAPKPEPKPKKKEVAVAKVKEEKKPKEEKLTVVEYEQQAKDGSAKLWKKRIKGMRKSMATVKVGDKLTTAELIKLIGDSESLAAGGGAVKLFSDKLKKKKFTITKVVVSKGDWCLFQAESTSQKVIWKEGPIKNRHHITVPVIVER